jgi:hypothetical protein
VRSRYIRSLLAACFFGLAFVVNPAWVAGCVSTSDSSPNFGEKEMAALFAIARDTRTWSFSTGGTEYQVELMLQRDVAGSALLREVPSARSFLPQAHACGSRTFLQSASACITMTELPFTGALTLRKRTGTSNVIVVDAAPLVGEILVYGERLMIADLNVRSAKASTFDLALVTSKDLASFMVSSFNGLALGAAGSDLHYAGP